MEMIGLNLQGRTHNITIENNKIYDIGQSETWYGFGFYVDAFCNATIKNNNITYCSANGIFANTDANCTIIGNDITYNGNMTSWQYRSGVLCWISTPKLIQNNISDNFGVAGVYIISTSSECVLEGNSIYNNEDTGVYVVFSDVKMDNNYIHNNSGTGIELYSWITIGIWIYIGNNGGSIENSIIENNNHSGIECDNTFWGATTFITTGIDNNSINDNGNLGIYALNCNPPIRNNTIFSNHQDGVWLNQRSNSFVYNNTIYNNKYSGLYVISSTPNILENNISGNNWTGIECTTNANAVIEENIINYNNYCGIYLFSNSDATVRYNDIHYNNWSGIQTYGSSPTIRYNQITFNNQNGIYSYQRGSTNIRIQYNNLTSNSWNGVECNLSSPIISNNDLSNNTRNGLFLNASSPTIQNDNKIIYNQHNGIACYLGSSPTIINDLKFNSMNGLYVNGSSPVVQDSTISNNGASGIFATAGSNPAVENSTIELNSEYSFNISDNSHTISLNSSVNFTKVYFDDLASTLIVQWFLHVKTVDDNNNLVGMSDIWVNTTTQTPSGVWSGQTRPDGLRPWLHVTECVKSDNNGDHDGEDAGETTVWNPYNITGDKFGYGKGYADPEPTMDHSKWVTVILPKNKKPSEVSNIKPDSTHSLRPEITWDAAIDPDGQYLTYYINVGTWPNGTNVVFNQTTTNTNYTFSSDLTYGTLGNNTYYVLIYADDGDGGFSRVNDYFYVINNFPTTPGINITPRRPNTLMKSLTCTINTTSTDLDGDGITYTYRWYKNGVLQNNLLESATTALTDTISVVSDDIEFVIGDTWMCRVTANDGIVASFRDEDSVTFGNIIPEVNDINDLYMDEDTEVKGWINLSEIFEDPDPPKGGTPYRFWVTGNENISITINPDGYVDVKPDPDWNGVETVTFWANDTGSKVAQVQTEATITVNPVNDAPSLVMVGKVDVEDGKSISFLDTKGALQGRLFRLQILSTDIDIENGEIDSLLYTTNSTKVTVTTDPISPLQANLTFTPDNEDVLKKKLHLRLELRDAEDGIIDDYVDLVIDIRNINDPPSIVSFTHVTLDKTFDVIESNNTKYIEFLDNDNCAYENQWFNLTVHGYDPDPGDVISFDSDDIRFFVAPDQEDKFSSHISFKPTQSEVGIIIFNITATDSEGGKDAAMVKILIKNVNNPPDAKILKPTRREFDIGETIDFEGDFYDQDLPGDTHTFKWTSDLDGELGTSLVLENVELSTGIHEITFTVEDGGGAKDLMVITITIGGADTDRDGLPDTWEEQYFNSLEWGAGDDPDNDKLTNLEEYELKSDPSDPDSPTPQDKKSGDDDESDMGLFTILAIVIVIIIVIIILFLVLKKRKDKAQAEAAEGEPAPGAGAPAELTREQMGYIARPVPTLDELFPEGVPPEELAPPKPRSPEEAPVEKKSKPLPVGIGLPPEELRKELRKGSRRDEEQEMAQDRGSEDVLFRAEADQEQIFERPAMVKEFRPVHETPENIEHELPDSPFASATIKELDGSTDEPIIMDREPEDLEALYKEDEKVEDLDEE
jgi:parallel beta-helix repeat protein